MEAPIHISFLNPEINAYYQEFRKQQEAEANEAYTSMVNNANAVEPSFTSAKEEAGIKTPGEIKNELRKISGNKSCVVPANSNTNEKEKPPASLFGLMHAPVHCPIDDCELMVGATTMLQHYLQHHGGKNGSNVREVHNGKCSLIFSDPRRFNFRENTSLGLLMFGGMGNNRSSCPAEYGICTRNCFSSNEHVRFENHMPIIIMACKTSFSAMLPKNLEREVTKPEDKSQQLLVLWLASMTTTRPIYATMTVHNKMMTSAQSAIIRVRDLNESQNPANFLVADLNCLCLTHGDMTNLTADRNGQMLLEVIINEYNELDQ